MAKILLIEDDPHLSVNIVDWLKFERHNVDHVVSGDLGLEYLKSTSYDAVILDWELPELAGIDVCRRFRFAGGKTPILFLTGRDAIQDKEKGLDAGADDYLTKPFHMRELSARLRALLRRPASFAGSVLKVGHLELDPAASRVTIEGKEMRLPKTEYALLEFFMRNTNQLMTQDSIIERVWKTDASGSPETFRQCLKRLRAKIDLPDKPSLIKNIHGVGYVMETYTAPTESLNESSEDGTHQ